MALFPFRSSGCLTSLREQGSEALDGVKAAANQSLEHVIALWQLLQIELREYAAHQARRVIVAVVGVLLLLFGYLLLCAVACIALQMWVGSWLLAVGVVCVLHLLGGAVLLLIVARQQPGPVAPATRQEIQNDWQCLKLLISKENSKS